MSKAAVIAWVVFTLPLGAQTAAELAAAGARHLEANRAAEAQAAFTASLDKNPQEFEALSGMGFLSFVKEDFGAARRYLEQAVTVRPGAFQARFLLGAVLVQLGDPEGATVHLKKALAIDPRHGDARKLLASQYVETRRYKDALALLQPAVNAPPFDEETHLLLIEARQTSGDSAGAFALARTAAQRFPRSAPVLAWLGFQLQFAGRYEAAKAPLRRAIELAGDYPIPLQVLGEIYLQEENYAEAVQWLSKAAARMPDDPDTLLALARAQTGTGDTTAALATLHHAARSAPSDARVPLQLSRLYFQLGDEVAAQREAERSTRLRESNPAAAAALPAPRRR